MASKLVPVRQATLGLQGPVEHIAADVKERGGLLILLQKVVEGIMGAVGTVVKREPPRFFFGATDDVRLQARQLGFRAGGFRPPTVRVRILVVVDTLLRASGHTFGGNVGDALGDGVVHVLGLRVTLHNVGNLPSCGECVVPFGRRTVAVRFALLGGRRDGLPGLVVVSDLAALETALRRTRLHFCGHAARVAGTDVGGHKLRGQGQNAGQSGNKGRRAHGSLRNERVPVVDKGGVGEGWKSMRLVGGRAGGRERQKAEAVWANTAASFKG